MQCCLHSCFSAFFLLFFLPLKSYMDKIKSVIDCLEITSVWVVLAFGWLFTCFVKGELSVFSSVSICNTEQHSSLPSWPMQHILCNFFQVDFALWSLESEWMWCHLNGLAGVCYLCITTFLCAQCGTLHIVVVVICDGGGENEIWAEKSKGKMMMCVLSKEPNKDERHRTTTILLTLMTLWDLFGV